VLECHPDKGGDAAVFRDVRTAFEVLRELFQRDEITSFAAHYSQEASAYDKTFHDVGGMPVPSWDFYSEYYDAPMEEMPPYRVEFAKSGRSKCCQKSKAAKKCDDPLIGKGLLRVGSLDEESGSYARWHHVACWRVPARIWLGLPEDPNDPDVVAQALLGMNSVLLSGVDKLDDENLKRFVEHVMDKSNWAKRTKRIVIRPKEAPAAAAAGTAETNASKEQQISRRTVFVPPKPGVNGAEANALDGQRVVLTGVFPEVGGGAGLNLGKDRTRAIIESFGGTVTSSISGKTNLLIIGREPGAGKVSSAEQRNVKMVTLATLKEGLEGRCLESMQPPPVITNFSSGYQGKTILAQGAEPTKKAPPKKPSKKAPPKKAQTKKAQTKKAQTKKAAKKAPPKSKALEVAECSVVAAKTVKAHEPAKVVPTGMMTRKRKLQSA
jgi:hypothetical protein